MDIKSIAEKVNSGEYKTLEGNDTFKFNCKRCGGCCIAIDDIVLFPYDVYKIAKHLKITGEEVLNKYCRIVLGGQSKMPMVILNQADYNFKNHKVKCCPFLKSNIVGQCSCQIQEVKPFVCAVYPLGRVTSVGKEGIQEVKFFEQDTHCPHGKHNEVHTLNEWIDNFNLKEYDKFSDTHNSFMYELNKKISLAKFCETEIITKKTKQIYFNALVQILYTNFDFDKNIEENLKEKYKEILDATDLMILGAKAIGINIESQW